ncbi:cytochrome P450 [Amylocarpus encephaloides]|uniref:Cytochrome P450 n=1 Tax=Amylocarpus encephaloides TaxID=45428 RepID=A0A9P7YRQ1_9HELO|nr:cytochrome P450 [Amylocarpus encephaloides]
MPISEEVEAGSNRSLLKNLAPVYVISTVFLGLVIFTLQNWNKAKTAKVQIINSYPYDFSKRKAHAEFFSNSRGLIKNGVEKVVQTRIPSNYHSWVSSHSSGLVYRMGEELSRVRPPSTCTVHHEYFAQYPGFECNAGITDPEKILVKVAKTKLNQTVQTKECRRQVQLARDMLKPILDKRRRLEEKTMVEVRGPPIYDDTIEWIALHATTELLKQTLIDLCAHPELMEPVREEFKSAVAEFGWTTAGVYKMQLIDSIVKETQRLEQRSLGFSCQHSIFRWVFGQLYADLYFSVDLERKVLREVVLPKGEDIAVDSSMIWDASIYPDPNKYDGYRFLKLRQSGSTSAAFIISITSTEHIAFGLGRPVCLGRFFAANEVKIALAKLCWTTM